LISYFYETQVSERQSSKVPSGHLHKPPYKILLPKHPPVQTVVNFGDPKVEQLLGQVKGQFLG